MKIMKSKVIGVGGVDTGNGLFTMKPIPSNTWVCSYAPSSPFQDASNAEGDYTLEFTWRNQRLAVDGRKCKIGLGQLLNDGKQPSVAAVLPVVPFDDTSCRLGFH